VNHGGNDGTNDRCCHVKPGLAEIARHDHRPQRPRRVESGACEGPAQDDVEGQGHSDRKRREITGAARDRSALVTWSGTWELCTALPATLGG
jgi:hypothetical protein